MTPYGIWKDKKPNLSHFHIFGSTCYILRDRGYLGKCDSKSDIGVLIGYSNNSITYHVCNMRTQTIIEFVNVVVDDFKNFVEFLKKRKF